MCGHLSANTIDMIVLPQLLGPTVDKTAECGKLEMKVANDSELQINIDECVENLM